MLDKQLGRAGMRSDLLYLTKVDQESTMTTDNHRIALQHFLHLFHGGAQHVGMHLTVAQMVHLDIVANSLNK